MGFLLIVVVLLKQNEVYFKTVLVKNTRDNNN